jgi:hypothetical protein
VEDEDGEEVRRKRILEFFLLEFSSFPLSQPLPHPSFSLSFSLIQNVFFFVAWRQASRACGEFYKEMEKRENRKRKRR